MTDNTDAAPATLGILMLDTRFPRPPGDIGNPLTWPFPIRYRTVPGALPKGVVEHDDPALLEPFAAAAERLVADGVDGIATSCGFLVRFQHALAARCAVPVATSALLQIPLLERLLAPERRVGVITISAASLGRAHWRAAGAATDTPVIGVDPDGAFAAIIDNRATLDRAAARADLLDAAARLRRTRPEVGALLLECTNMAPYSAALAAATGLPVYDIYTLLRWFYTGLRPRRFAEPPA